MGEQTGKPDENKATAARVDGDPAMGGPAGIDPVAPGQDRPPSASAPAEPTGRAPAGTAPSLAAEDPESGDPAPDPAAPDVAADGEGAEAPRREYMELPPGYVFPAAARIPAHARARALWLLDAVIISGRTLASALPEAVAGLEPSEAARAGRLATETLRQMARADRLLGPWLRLKPVLPVLNLLRLGTVELGTGGAAHGVVSSAVDLARSSPATASSAGLTNAVLRRVSNRRPDLGSMPVPTLPKALRKRLIAAWGKPAVTAMEAVQIQPPPLDLTPGDGNAAALAEATGGEALPTGSVRLAAGAVQVSALPGYAEGLFWVQDAAAALPARLLAVQPGERVLDLCAAPGGKTLQLAAAGADVTALDLSEARLARLHENLARTGLSAKVVVADALTWDGTAPATEAPAAGDPPPPHTALSDTTLLDAAVPGTGSTATGPTGTGATGAATAGTDATAKGVAGQDATGNAQATLSPTPLFDAILLDAPCSATGTLRRHPDLPHIRAEADLTPLLELQAGLIDRAVALLAPGGRLVFCTCSLFPEEGEAQAEAALARHPGLHRDPAPIQALLDAGGLDPAFLTDRPGELRIRPDHWADRGGIDGFHISAFRLAEQESKPRAANT